MSEAVDQFQSRLQADCVVLHAARKHRPVCIALGSASFEQDAVRNLHAYRTMHADDNYGPLEVELIEVGL
jgi:hypothetical protein